MHPSVTPSTSDTESELLQFGAAVFEAAALSLAPWRWVWRRHGFSDRNERVRQVCEKSYGARRRSRLALDRQARAPKGTRRHRNRAGSGFSLYFPLMTSLIISVVLS
jgi:hypothetical protein